MAALINIFSWLGVRSLLAAGLVLLLIGAGLEAADKANIRDLAAEYAPDMVIYSVYRAMFEDIDASTPEEFCTSCAKMVSEPELFFQAIA